ncbi:hypothetical protein BGW36DRAFT_151774 [Talaromyces proteolyticus]|uniref:Secreted protein n=1 Tax=Talaromyces proteolyticus TaxID=1131652 RepID=A0AAD4KYI2_9EURO|nr:uncharacterized protein BGW36DRAFT_151774 [Talaromyces proteolyticus]KAH8698871.1 hypothetical protein BGW36DRAFT_151774 [Talaromyces proteolyticus]
MILIYLSILLLHINKGIVDLSVADGICICGTNGQGHTSTVYCVAFPHTHYLRHYGATSQVNSRIIIPGSKALGADGVARSQSGTSLRLSFLCRFDARLSAPEQVARLAPAHGEGPLVTHYAADSNSTARLLLSFAPTCHFDVSLYQSGVRPPQNAHGNWDKKDVGSSTCSKAT